MELYIHPAGTTSRAVLAFCKKEKLDVTVRIVDITQGEQHQAPFCVLNPNRMVPVLTDDGLVLSEAAAILRYLAQKTDSALYPRELKTRARIDELMSWFEANFFRDFGFQYVYPQVFPHHARRSNEATQATVQWGRDKANAWLAVLDQHYLADGKTALVGALSIADLFGVSILSLAELVGHDLEPFPNVRAWYRAVTQDEAWATINQAFMGFAEYLRGQH